MNELGLLSHIVPRVGVAEIYGCVMGRPIFQIIPGRDCYLGMHLEEYQSLARGVSMKD
jgi:hypothetical protein